MQQCSLCLSSFAMTYYEKTVEFIAFKNIYCHSPEKTAEHIALKSISFIVNRVKVHCDIAYRNIFNKMCPDGSNPR